MPIYKRQSNVMGTVLLKKFTSSNDYCLTRTNTYNFDNQERLLCCVKPDSFRQNQPELEPTLCSQKPVVAQEE